MNFCTIGLGGRGTIYTNLLIQGGFNLTAVCDLNPAKLKLAKSNLKLNNNQLFLNDNDFFLKGKLGDLLVISTQDSDHIAHATKALNCGYDLLLEKPIACTMQDCEQIYTLAKSLNKKVFVCHVLRYAPFFQTIKRELMTGDYGKISTMNLTENVDYWHQSHSYVRGNWANTKQSSPMIVAKCCHDLDILSYLNGKPCVKVSSFGSLGHYKNDNAPQLSGDRCLDCKLIDSCIYSAKKYITDGKVNGFDTWPMSSIATDRTEQGMIQALETTNYGKCVYKCDNDAVDHQVVNLLYSNGSTAHLTMTAFSKDCYRNIHVHCEKGEIYGNMNDNKLICNMFGKSQKTIDIDISMQNEYSHHGGGDYYLIQDVLNFYSKSGSMALTSIEQSMESHRIGFLAEKSRQNDGEVQIV